MSKMLIVAPNVALMQAENVPALLGQIRPLWQARRLIERVRALLNVDPSSACQRLLNAAIADLKEKVVIAGLDIATQAAVQHRLPPVTRDEDIEHYSTAKLIELTYRMGLLNRAEWRRLSRCYEIRRDLEHEDDEYEAGVEDCLYIFKTCIEVMLARDPIQVIRVIDFKTIVDQPSAAIPNDVLLEDFKNAPQPRQEEIGKYLLGISLDKKQPDLVQQNAISSMSKTFSLLTNPARVALGSYLQQQFGRDISERQARVAHAAGLLPYIRQSARASFFDAIYVNMETVTHHWSAHNQHGEVLRDFIDYGGLNSCPPDQLKKITRWLIRAYIGEPGGRTSYGNVRPVFYSNTASYPIEQIFRATTLDLVSVVNIIRAEKELVAALADKHVALRFEKLMDTLDKP